MHCDGLTSWNTFIYSYVYLERFNKDKNDSETMMSDTREEKKYIYTFVQNYICSCDLRWIETRCEWNKKMKRKKETNKQNVSKCKRRRRWRDEGKQHETNESKRRAFEQGQFSIYPTS